MSSLYVMVMLVGVLIIVATVLPLSRSHRWWVRICDFPRFQVAVLAVGVLALLVMAGWPFGVFDSILFAGVALSAAWQVSWVWRYVPGAPLEVESSNAVDAPGRIALLTTNVLQQCRDSGALLKIIGEADPDVVLAVETDEWWCSRLTEGLSARYPHSLIYPLSNGYGLAAFSRLELRDPSVRFLVDDAIPSIKTGIRLRSGAVIDLYGLHPQPPAPQQD